MGLTAIAMGKKGELVWNPHDEEMESADQIYLSEWNKHPNLHGFMQNLYGEGDIGDVEVELKTKDIDELEKRINENSLPETKGFFFGENADEYYAEQDRKFIADARKAIKDGYSIFYYSCW